MYLRLRKLYSAVIIGGIFTVVLYYWSLSKKGSSTTDKHGQGVSTADEAFVRDHEQESVRIPGNNQLDALSEEAIKEMYYRYINNIQIFCHRMVRMGYVNDGGWEICDDKLFRPQQPCLVYSFGIGGDFSFDDAMATRYQCEVHSFDPSIGLKDHMHAPQVHFHNLGIAGSTRVNFRGWPLMTLMEIRKGGKHLKQPIDVLKMDVEGMEWETIQDMIRSGALQDVRQFMCELHLRDTTKDKVFTAEDYKMRLKVLRDLYDVGFRIFWRIRNLFPPLQEKEAACQEVSFVNVNYSSR